jgi:ribulose bisphosphate carboxylase small subunit
MRQERHWYWSCWGCFYSNYVEEILNRLDECTAATSHFCKTLAWCLR